MDTNIEFKPRDIVYSRRRNSTFILQSRERSGSQWYCILADNKTHNVIQEKKYGCLQSVDCYVWEYDIELIKREL